MKRYVRLAILLVVILFLCATTVNAAYSFTATMTPSQSTVAESSEVVITIKVSNLDVGANGINSLGGYLKYDKEIFEEISDTSMEGLENWVASYNPETGKIGLLKNTFVKDEQNVLQITFKTKAGTTNKVGAISFEDIEASNSEEEIKAANISTNITVSSGAPSNDIPEIPVTNEPENITEQNVVENIVENKVENKEENKVENKAPVNSNPSNTQMPHTGVEDNITFAIIIFAIIAIISFIKYKSIKEY